MKRILQLMMICALSTFHFHASAEEPVTPPAGLSEETWTMIYDNYRNMGREPIPTSCDTTHNVTFVRDNSTLYVKGVFTSYPDSWIKGTVNGDTLSFDQSNYIHNDYGTLTYAMCGEANYSWNDGTTHFHQVITLYSSSDNKFIISQDGNYITSETSVDRYEGYPIYTAFSYNYKPTSYLELIQGYDNGGDNYRNFPDKDFPVNIRFSKGDSSISNIVDDKNQSLTYDLYGRRVNPDNLRPGIYIRNGRKFIVK